MNHDALVPLCDLTCDDSPQFGGKAANLGEMASMGIKIPRGIAVGKDMLALFLESHGIDLASVARIHSLGMTFIESALQEASEIQKKIINVLTAGSFPSEIEQKIFDKLSEFEDCAFAVRSSCVVEDARLTSFAGQYVSILNVVGREEILRAIRQCWSSQYAGKALTYALTRRGMPVLSPSMAIVIQRMLKSTYAGVCFTSGPTPKTRENIVIEIVSGCGEALVSGCETPCHFEISRDGEVLKKLIPEASLLTQPPDQLVTEVATICVSIAEHFGAPQDVEWATEGGDLYFLQARPITVSAGRKEPASVSFRRQASDLTMTARASKIGNSQGKSELLRDQLHEWLISDCDIAAFRAVCYLLLNQREDGSWRVEGKPEWDEVATAMTVYLLVNGGYPASLKWIGPTDTSGEKKLGLPVALRWLASRTKPDGTWGSDLWDTCQVLRAFSKCGISTNDSVIKPGLAYVVNEIHRHLSRSRRQEWFGPGVLAVAIDLFAELEMHNLLSQCVELLLTYQKSNGEFYGPSLAHSGVKVPSEWHTAQAITALSKHVVPSQVGGIQSMLDKSCHWLLSRQKIDGSWGVTYEPYCHYNTFFTSYAMIALSDAGKQYSESVQKARKWLRSKQLADGSFGDIASCLMAVSALQRYDGTVLAVRIPIPFFLRIQHILGNNDY